MKNLIRKAGALFCGKTIYIHIAGTNGKTSVTRFLSAALTRFGYRTGAYTSPHIEDIRERICVDGEKISKRDFLKYFFKVRTMKIKLSFFEYLTAIALLYFRDKELDFAILESGMGGKLDATNIVDSQIVVITDIGRDHENFLGRGLKNISAHKAGVIKQKASLIISEENRGCEYVLKHARRKNAEIFHPGKITGARNLPLYQRENIALVEKALSVLKNKFGFSGINLNAFRRVAGKVALPGRFEKLQVAGRTIILDGAHNLAAAQKFLKSVEKPQKGKIVCLFSMMSDKDYKSVLRKAITQSGAVFVTEVSSSRTLKVEFVRERFRDKKIRFEKSLKKAFQKTLRYAGKNDLILVFGSLYLVAEVKAILNGRKILFPEEMPQR